ncbi:MAG: tetratricopeptide repeat protein [Marinobacter sp.]|uniref:tetratricopeptide repeat protein n=1 Tax=Marinobacter sp. TaxID=50741 RepID=UPI00396E9AB8
MLFRPVNLLLVAWLAILSPALKADSGVEAANQLRAGIAAFKAGNLDRAQALLESAADLGLQSRALTYNLGVIYYKTGDLHNAERMFRQLTETRQRSLAFYNLGLIALAQEDKAGARAAFREVVDTNDADNLTRLAAAQLEKLGESAPLPPWQALSSLAAGYEDNIGLFPDEAASTIEDSFLELVAAVSGYLYRQGKHGFRLRGQAYAREYDSEDEFNSQLVRLDTNWEYRLDDYRLYAGIGGDKLWYGDKPREERARVSGGVSTPACAIAEERARCSVSARAEHVSASSRYDAYDGRHYRLDARYQARLGDWGGGLRYYLDYDDRRNLATEREYFSVSPLGQTLELSTRYYPLPDLEIGGVLGYRYSFYRTAHRLRIPEGTWIINRVDKRLSLSVNADYRINDTISVVAGWRGLHNDSNIPRYDYERSTATLGVTVLL